MRILLIPLLTLALTGIAAADNVIQDGDFPGTALSAAWNTGREYAGIAATVEKPEGFGQGKSWLHLVDGAEDGAVKVSQKFPGVGAGRLSLTLHIVQHKAAIWFVLGQGEVSAKSDISFGIKVSSAGGLLVGNDAGKIVDASGARANFTPGETYRLHCDFKLAPGNEGLEIKITQEGNGEIFNGVATPVPPLPIDTLSIRTHREQAGSDFYVTDISLTPSE
jgi:hypothetical protein